MLFRSLAAALKVRVPAWVTDSGLATKDTAGGASDESELSNPMTTLP